MLISPVFVAPRPTALLSVVFDSGSRKVERDAYEAETSSRLVKDFSVMGKVYKA